MTDERMRALERAAATGGPEAQEAWARAQHRTAHQIPTVLEDYDWEQVFEYSGVGDRIELPHGFDPGCSQEEFSRTDVQEVIALSEGENDGPDWVAVLKLWDGRYAYIEAGCDYTGFD